VTWGLFVAVKGLHPQGRGPSGWTEKSVPKPTSMTTPSVERPLPSRVVRQEFFEIDLRSDGIVWLTRLPKAYTTIASLHRAYDEMLSAVDSWLLERRILQRHIGTRQRTMMGWLYDVRNVRSHRNDDAFERAVQKRQLDLVKRSPLVAVLVKTAAGRAQMHRLRRAEDQGDPEVFDDDSTALAWLLERMHPAVASERQR
jgi:hypothetical protein